MSRYAFYFDGSRCNGCKTCQLACKDYRDLPASRTYRRVCEYQGGSWGGRGGAKAPDVFEYYVSVACNHCDSPACAEVCPTEAMSKDGATGLVAVDADRCIGCGYCEMACPYGAPTVDRGAGHSTKCDGCSDRVAVGLSPICVEACPQRALDFGDAQKMKAKGEMADIAPLPPKTLTGPNLYVTAHRDAQPSDERAGTRGSDGRVTNPLEVL